MSGGSDHRLVPLGHRPNALCSLVCFPHAGGSPSAFRGWDRLFPEWQVCAVNYPGRAKRFGEPLPTDIIDVGRSAAQAIKLLRAPQTLLFGHSMGAVVALEAARRLEALDVACAALVVSGSRNGLRPVESGRGESDLRDDAELAQHMVSMGGMPSDLCEDPDFLSLVLPYVRADGAMFRNYLSRLEPAITAPIIAIVGREDDHSDIRPWAQMTTSTFSEFMVDGDHFYLNGTPPVGLLNMVGRTVITAADAMERSHG